MSMPTTQSQQLVAPDHPGDVISYQRSHVVITGNVTGAIFLSQLIVLSRQHSHTDGWISKTQHEWQALTGMTRSEHDSARKSLRTINLLEEARRGMPATLCFRLNKNQLEQLLPGSILAEGGCKLVCSEEPSADEVIDDEQKAAANQFAENSKLKRYKALEAVPGTPTATQKINWPLFTQHVGAVLYRLESKIHGSETKLKQLSQLKDAETVKQSQSLQTLIARIEYLLIGLIILAGLMLMVCLIIWWHQSGDHHGVAVKKSSSAQMSNAVRAPVK